MDPGGPPPAVSGTTLSPSDSAKESLGVNVPPTTWTGVSVEVTSEAPAATKPERPEIVVGTHEGAIAESPFSVPSEESEEVQGEDVGADTVEDAESVAFKPLDGIGHEVDVGDDELVPEGSEEERVLSEDDQVLGVTPEGVRPPQQEAIEEVTPHGEEPPSETVVEEVFTEAAVMVLVKPTVVHPTEAGMLEHASVKPTAGQKVEEAADDSLDDATHVEVTDVVEEEHTAIAETLPHVPESTGAAAPVDTDEDVQVPPVERPTEARSGVQVELVTETLPTVLLMTSDYSEEAALEPAIEVEPPSQEDVDVVTLQDNTGDDVTESQVEEVSVPEVEMTRESDADEPTVAVVSQSANEDLKEQDAPVAEVELVETEETVSLAEHTTEPSAQFTLGAMTDDRAAKTVQETTEESSVATVRPSETPEPTKATELVEEPATEAEQVEAPEEREESIIQPPGEEADSVKEVDVEEKPVGGSLPEPGEEPREDEPDVDATPLENSEVVTEEPLEHREEATTVPLIPEDTGGSDLMEGTLPEVLDELITETFEITTPEPDDVITPVIAVVPEDAEGLLPKTEDDKDPDHEVPERLPEDSESDLQPAATAGPSQVPDPIKEGLDSEDLSKVEEEILQEVPGVLTQEVVTHAWTWTKVGAIEPDKVTQDGLPKDRVISIEESVLQEVEVFQTNDEAKDAAEPTSAAPVVATSESFVRSTSGAKLVTTEEPPEEVTTPAPAKPTTKYVVEYNNGNFPDLTEGPYFVDDNLLGNNGFDMDEDENSVRTQYTRPPS